MEISWNFVSPKKREPCLNTFLLFYLLATAEAELFWLLVDNNAKNLNFKCSGWIFPISIPSFFYLITLSMKMLSQSILLNETSCC